MQRSQNCEVEIINIFLERYDNPTLKKMQEITGIHYVRLFRLINGYTMTHDEYSLFQDAIRKSNCGREEWSDIITQCEMLFTQSQLYEIGEDLSRRLKLARYLRSPSEENKNKNKEKCNGKIISC